ncbi:MAG: hypothetical protein ACKOJ7_03475 [Betaproteobacteria bacterium]
MARAAPLRTGRASLCRAFFIISVLAALFIDFVVPPAFQKRVLMIGIIGAIVLRTVMILLAAVAAKFHLLSYGLAVILAFIGTKMLLIDVVKIPVLVSLGVVVAILVVTMVVSLKTAPKLPSGVKG